MNYRKLGNSDLVLSEITFGAWAVGGWMWGGTEHKDSINAIKAAYDSGITSIDTAPIYGQGASEEIVGEAIQGMPRDKVQILTKYGVRWKPAESETDFSSLDNAGSKIDIYRHAGKESIIKECEDSLRRLGTDYIDLYQIHWPDTSTPISESMEAVDRLIEQGKVRYAGVCNYSAKQLAEASKYVDVISDQIPYSMLKRGIEKDQVPYCLENSKGILAYSPMERGLLAGKILPGHKFADGDHRAGLPAYKNENLKRVGAFLDKLRPLAADKNATLAQLVLRWTLEQPGITIALVGARNAEQAKQNAKTAELKLTGEELSFITSELKHLELVKA